MRAIKVTANKGVELAELPKPRNANTEHIIIKMQAVGINAGDNAFINGVFPKGSIPESQYNLAGVSGVGTVIEVGRDVPEEYKGKNVTVYRSLKFSEHIVGTWSEYTQLHYLQCVIVPENLNLDDYSGSLVNIITPYAFLKQIIDEGHKAIICTAGNSSTGIALLGICQAYNFQLISIVRNDEGKKELEILGAKNIIVQSDSDFKEQLKEFAQALKATAIFDGVGGAILNNIVDVIPFGSTIYSYGYLGGQTPFSFHTSILMRGITIKAFNNFRSSTVQNKSHLEKGLKDISSMLNMPHFKTKIGRTFTMAEVNEALQFSSPKGEKPVICF
jgi:NADPH:quinone reductase-like Zn-dependent oxidoreductase